MSQWASISNSQIPSTGNSALNVAPESHVCWVTLPLIRRPERRCTYGEDKGAVTVARR